MRPPGGPPNAELAVPVHPVHAAHLLHSVHVAATSSAPAPPAHAGGRRRRSPSPVASLTRSASSSDAHRSVNLPLRRNDGHPKGFPVWRIPGNHDGDRSRLSGGGRGGRRRAPQVVGVRSEDESGGGGDRAGGEKKERKRVDTEYGRVGREELRKNIISAFPKFILTSASLISVAGAYDFFKFYRSMKNSGADGRWRKLADGDRSGKEGHAGEPTVIYDVRGRVVATLSSEAVKLKDVAPAVWQAIVASEDHRFFRHSGVDIRGLLRAIGSLGKAGGGSTITQQLVKNLVLSQDRTISRKAAEILLSLKIEKHLSKEELLEAYLNNVYWGHGVYGIAGAAAAYYGKTPAQLDVGEAALLASLLPAPEALSPYANPAGAKRVRANALHCMAKHGYLNEKQAEEFAKGPLPASLALRPPSELEKSMGLEGSDSLDGVYTGGRGVPRLGRGSAAPYRAPFFVSEVLYHLKELFAGQDVLSQGGLKVHTTLDLALQEKAEQLVLEDGLSMLGGEDKGEAALVAIDPAQGAVRVLIGGREYANSPFNRAVLSRRTSGSAFKPFVYLAALAEGVVNPSTLLEDEDQTFEVPEGEEKTYQPMNYTRKFKGTVSLRDCLVESLNVPTVKVAEMVGVDKIIEMSHRLGITSPLPNALSLALGSCETTPLEMCVAYATIASGGVYSKPHLITKVRDRTGSVVYRHRGSRRLAANASATAALHSMLRAVVTRGTGQNAAAGWPAAAVAGKTGTSDEYRDAWFAGYTPSLACVVWAGRDNNTSLPGTGATIAAPLWAKFMRAASTAGVAGDKSQSARRRASKWKGLHSA